jgi:hypothetical protein
LTAVSEQGHCEVITVTPDGANPSSLSPEAIRYGEGNHFLALVAVNQERHSVQADAFASSAVTDHQKINVNV